MNEIVQLDMSKPTYDQEVETMPCAGALAETSPSQWMLQIRSHIMSALLSCTRKTMWSNGLTRHISIHPTKDLERYGTRLVAN